MNTIECEDWEDFEERLSVMKPTISQDSTTGKGSPSVVLGSLELVFRGQANACWRLETTLERAQRLNFACSGYQAAIHAIKDEIEAFSGRRWIWKDQSEIVNEFPTAALDSFPELRNHPVRKPQNTIANLSYMTYLRHFGFPSPLLDWTLSPYIAAFFGASSKSDEPWAIFVHDEFPINTLVPPRPYAAATIATIKDRAGAQQRHFLQQSRYTVCTSFDRLWRYADHEKAWSGNHPSQNVVTKFVFQSETRRDVCSMLQKMNINAYSLFGTEESLIQALASRFVGP
jgi:hypothetical protein